MGFEDHGPPVMLESSSRNQRPVSIGVLAMENSSIRSPLMKPWDSFGIEAAIKGVRKVPRERIPRHQAVALFMIVKGLGL